MWSTSLSPPGDGWRRYGPGAQSRFRDFGHGEIDWTRIGVGLMRRGFDGVLVTEFEDSTATVAESIARSNAPIRGWLANLRR
jgi:sugar phosphate isomerase/epimerase